LVTIMDINALKALIAGKKAEIDARKTTGVQFAKIAAGTSRWRILPGWRPGETHIYSHNFGQHWFKDADGKPVAVAVCLWDTFGQPCEFDGPIREAARTKREELSRLGMDKDAIGKDPIVKALYEMQSRRISLVNAVQIDGAGFDPAKAGVPQLLPLGATLDEGFHTILTTALADDVNVLDPAEGRDVMITKSGSGFGTEYKISMAAKSTPVPAGALEKMVNIDAFIESERVKGLQKGPEGFNIAMSAALKISGPSATRSLVGGSVPAAALAAPAAAAAAASVDPSPAVTAASSGTGVLDNTPPPQVSAAPASPSAEVYDDDELKNLLDSLGTGG
jgi:hypothetical protein